jgi:hypothetical protein
VQGCLNCGRWDRPLRSRGLCDPCYCDPVIRQAYPPLSNHSRLVEHDFLGAAADPAEPTRATPGSPEKIDVLTARAGQRLTLWNPADAVVDELAEDLAERLAETLTATTTFGGDWLEDEK